MKPFFSTHRQFAVVALLWLCLAGSSAQETFFNNPVLPGDHPDPSLIRLGNEYWATATTSEWAPIFPILHSRDLVNWETAGMVFPRKPEWSVGNYWASEIFHHQGKFYIYYTARKKGGPLCVAVATADKPQGPYTDHGPLVCQELGSIDAVATFDEHGELYLLWKEDGNSQNKPTPLWAQKLSDDGLRLVGEKVEVLRNDAPWEGHVVEGPFVARRNGYFYLFYSGKGCCGRGCDYALGVARAKKLLGPYEKSPANPILKDNEHWRCPGHGSIVTDQQGRDFLLYHAYDVRDFVYVARQGLLDEIKWGADGWPVINDGKGPSARAVSPHGAPQRTNHYHRFSDSFTSAKLKWDWQWPHSNEPLLELKPNKAGGQIELSVPPATSGSYAAGLLAKKTVTGSYAAIAEIDRRALRNGGLASLGAYGDSGNALGLAASDRAVFLWQRKRGAQEKLVEEALPASKILRIRMTASYGHSFRFDVSADGKSWRSVGDGISVKGEHLPPWDRGVRVAIMAGGDAGASATFNSFSLESKAP
jgi:xylan 1,4-beta-xylosidase